ncbi:hypothetical protein H0H93_007671, partial [Arthromyces matolae]
MLIMSSILVTSKSNVMTLILQFSPLTTRIPYAKTLTEISFQHPLVVGSALSMSGTETAVINVTRMYNFSDESGIFSFWGEFLSPNEPERKSESVFIRMVFETDRIGYLCNVERFKDESRFYLDHVVSSPFHGCGLPRFYGSYETTFYTKPKPSDSKLKCGCIIVQDCGVPDTSLIDSDEEFRSKAIELLIKLHKYGIRHGSITWTGTNISDLGGAPFFNDLSLARIHNCQDKAIEVTGDILEVDTDYLQCGELKDILRIISFTLYPDYFEWCIDSSDKSKIYVALERAKNTDDESKRRVT